jgi:hypothetical protein
MTASASIVPSEREPASAERGMVRSAGSTTTRIAANGTPCSAAVRATTCDSISMTKAPVRACSACLVSACAIGSGTPRIAPLTAPGMRRASRCAQRASALCTRSWSITEEAITQLPGFSVGAMPPATPKLTRPDEPAAIACVSTAPRFLPSPPQTTRTPRLDAMRASKAIPTTTIIPFRPPGRYIPKETLRLFPLFRLR